MSKPIVAIVGRPNVGKSMLFNKLTGKRMAIVEDTPGVTRDRIYGECEWNGRGFALVDTGGIEPGTNNEMLKFMRRQAEIAIETATVIVMVVDVTVGLTAADAEVASMLKRSKKPVVLAVNKCDQTGHANPDAYEFYALGLGDPIGFPPSTAMEPATCSTRASKASRRTTARNTTRTSSRSPSSASRTSANRACSIRFSARSA